MSVRDNYSFTHCFHKSWQEPIYSAQCFHKSSQCSKCNEWMMFPHIMAVFPYKEGFSVVSRCVISDDGIVSNISLPVSSMEALFRSFLILISILPRIPTDFHLV